MYYDKLVTCNHCGALSNHRLVNEQWSTVDYVCSVCCETFSIDNNVITKLNSNVTINTGSVTCPHCNKSSNHKFLRECSTSTDYKCSSCGRAFFIWNNSSSNTTSINKVGDNMDSASTYAVESIFNQARVLENNMNFDDAVKLYNDIINKYPDSIEARNSQRYLNGIYKKTNNSHTVNDSGRNSINNTTNNIKSKPKVGGNLSSDFIIEIIRSVDSFCDKDMVNNEHKRALLNKRKRASSNSEYIESLICNNAFYKIQSDNILNILKKAVITRSLHLSDDIFTSINIINDRVKSMSKSELIKYGASSYDASLNQDKLIANLEFDYNFAGYYNAIMLGVVEYIYEDDCKYLINELSQMNPEIMAKNIYEGIYSSSLKYVNAYP